jgi:hypothetical protein
MRSFDEILRAVPQARDRLHEEVGFTGRVHPAVWLARISDPEQYHSKECCPFQHTNIHWWNWVTYSNSPTLGSSVQLPMPVFYKLLDPQPPCIMMRSFPETFSVGSTLNAVNLVTALALNMAEFTYNFKLRRPEDTSGAPVNRVVPMWLGYFLGDKLSRFCSSEPRDFRAWVPMFCWYSELPTQVCQ